jgi:hypothetical protein
VILEPKHQNFKDQYKLKRELKKILYQAPHVFYLWLLNDITFRQF